MRKALDIPPKFFTLQAVEDWNGRAVLELTITGPEGSTSMLFHGDQIDALERLVHGKAEVVRTENRRRP